MNIEQNETRPLGAAGLWICLKRLAFDTRVFPTKIAAVQAEFGARISFELSAARLRPHPEKYAALPADFIRALGGDKFAKPFTICGGAP